MSESKRDEQLGMEVEELRTRLDEAEETLRVIRAGEVDALVISGPEGEQVYTLRGADHSYRILTETMEEGAATLDNDGTILYCNKRFADMLGLPLNKVIGSSLQEFLSEEKREILRERFKKGQALSGREEFYLRKEDGTGVPALLSFGSLQFDDFQGTCVTVTDLSGQKRVEEELRTANEELRAEIERREKAEGQLRQAQKMEAIGTLTGGIAHDFNNILATIVINSELALLDIDGKSELRTNLDLIFKSGLRGKDLVTQLLLFSRKSEKKQEIVPLSPVIKETFKLLRSPIPTTIQMKLQLETETDTVYADPSQIQQVILNLCTNAAYAMRGINGSIDVALQSVSFGPEDVPERDMEPGEYLVVSVKDSGPGMDEETQKRIFEPFFTTKPTGEGTGLGLSVVYGIVKNHKGNITVYSEPGKGSVFKVYLPKVDAGASAEKQELKPISKGTERILFVDDEEFIVQSVRNMLQHLGYKVTVLTDSREALKSFSSDPSQFDLVLTDQTMPFMTGEDLGKEMMRIRPDIPVILCTGYADFISSEKAREMGFRGYIMKPFTVREGSELVRRVLDESKGK